MGFNFPNERGIRQLQEAADLQWQLQRFYDQARYYDIQDLLEQQQRIEEDLQLQRADVLQDIQEAEQLRYTLSANHLDLQRAAQEALDQHERIQDALGADALEMVTWLAEQQARVSLEADRVTQITEQLDVNYLARTLRQAQELLSESTLNDMLAQADTQVIIREAEAAMDAALSEPAEFPGELAVGPPEWMRHLSRENLVALINLLSLLIDTLCAAYGVSLLLPGENAIEELMSDAEVQAVVPVLMVSLRWALYLLNDRKDG